MNIKFGHPNINCNEGLLKKIEEILNSGWVSIGTHMLALEYHFKEKFHVKHAIACSSATTGLIIAIKAAGWKNRRVALPAFTWPSTLYALECNGNIPEFCDIEQDTWQLLHNSYTSCADKMIAVDIFGSQAKRYCDMSTSYCSNDIIYDAAHSYGLPNLGKRGLAEVVSLSFTKRVTATEGGIILTDDDELAETAYELRRLSGRMEEINALIAMESIKQYLDTAGNDDQYFKENFHSVAIALTLAIINKYKKHITVPYKTQSIPIDTNNSVFSILFEEPCVRNAVMTALAGNGVETKVYYDPLVSGLPNTDYVYQRILSLPIHEDVIPVQDEIIEIINTSARGAKTPGKAYLTR